MATILIVYSTTDGHTRKICLRLKQVIETEGHRVSLQAIDADPTVDISPFDKIVLGASIRYGKHSKQVYQFIKTNAHILDTKANAFFSVNAVARKPEKSQLETNPYLIKFLKRVSWRPQEIRVFAGKIDYPKYRQLDRLMIRLIMWLTNGPTNPKESVEFTDWDQVESLGRAISKL